MCFQMTYGRITIQAGAMAELTLQLLSMNHLRQKLTFVMLIDTQEVIWRTLSNLTLLKNWKLGHKRQQKNSVTDRTFL